MIRKAVLKDIQSILEITKACAADMITKNIFQWNEFYPNKTPFINDLNRGELYAFEVENKVLGCITASTFMDEEYIPILWLTPNRDNIYIHRLTVHPEHQRQGHAQKLMTFAENQAREKKFKSVRLDTFSQNQRNQNFYEQRGYKKLGSIYFPKQSIHPFYCYELIL